MSGQPGATSGGEEAQSAPQASSPFAPAGWYPVDGAQRYWDGQSWTDHVAPLAGVHPASLSAEEVSSDDVLFAVLIHLSALFGWFIVPLILWLIRRDQSPFVDAHGRTAMNFQITYFVALICFAFLSILLIGIPFLILTSLAYFILPIAGAIKASQRELWTYPFVVRLFG